MKHLWQSAVIAFSMYSKIPMPRVDWNENNMKYAMAFFPLVGVPIGGLIYLWMMLSQSFALNNMLWATIAVIIPLAITGGIHLDGFCDTIDAVSSHQSKERKLEIMKDPHIGAFALIWVPIYLLLFVALWCQLIVETKAIILLAIGSVASRALSGLAVVTFPCAKNSGLAATFADGAAKKRVRSIMYGYILACIFLAMMIAPAYAIAMMVMAAVIFTHYYRMSGKQFGGITGDLAGYFLQLCEMGFLVAIIIVQLV